MVHLNGIGFENFKVFKEKTFFNFPLITLLTGTNSSGKSSLINGLRVLSENYRNNKEFDESLLEEFTLFQLFEKDFDSKYILERFGNIAQFVNNNSENQSFTFYLRQKFEQDAYFKIDDLFEYQFTISILNNKLRNGHLSKLEILSLNTDKIIFSIYRHLDNVGFVCKIDLLYYYSHYIDSIKQAYTYNKEIEDIADELKVATKENIGDVRQKLKLFNSKYGNNFQIKYSIDKTYKILRKPENYRILKNFGDEGFSFFDFDSLIKLPKSEKLRQQLKSKYPGELGKLKFTIGVMKFLSCVEWQDVNIDQHWQNNLEFIKFGTYLEPFSVEKFIDDYLRFSLKKLDNSEEGINEIEQNISAICNNIIAKNSIQDIDIETIINFFFVLFYNNQSKEDRFFIFDTPVKDTNTSNFFYNKFLFKNFNLILNSLAPFKFMSFLSVIRAIPKRTNSLLDFDDITRLTTMLLTLDEERFQIAKEFIDKWIQIFELGKGIEINKDPDSIQFKIYLITLDQNNLNSKKILLADAGYGVSQILPLILGVVNYNIKYEVDINEYIYNKNIVVIEEPETNLHPSLQSKLADMFIDASKKNTQLIIETHSEYLIRKFQYLTAVGEIDKTNTTIYYFSHPDKLSSGEPQVSRINFNKDGSLDKDFGPGFFDEADKIAISIWNIKHSQSN
jgi:predicted ATPase